jgi:hypothetical protein
MKPSIAIAARRYAKATNIPVGVFAEKAFIEYMVNHPNENHSIVIQQILPENRDIQHELEDDLLCSDISGYLETLSRIEATGHGSHSEFKLGLYKTIREAVKFRNPSDKLKELLHRVKERGYFAVVG